MKRLTTIILTFLCLFGLFGCRPAEKKAIETGIKTYYELPDGTWECEGYTYKYRLEITGRMHAAKADSTFVYLSNLENISFDQAAGAAGLSSNSEDYFSPDEAILVDWS